MEKTDIPGTYSARGGSAFGGNATGATLGPVNETNMARIWNKHKQPFDYAQGKANTPLKRKVFVAVSGGVDSSVALALLKKQGYDVTGCFMKNWSRNLPGLECNWVGDREDAVRVCAALDVPFRTVDLEKTYYEKVFKNFISEYKAGRTPNPDILCNSEVKFKAFLNWALQEGADMIATGHYARVGDRVEGIGYSQKTKTPNPKRYTLHPAADAAKDQSYFLYRLGQKELSRALFPIGEYTKPHVRRLAQKFNLPTAAKPDSQGVCFMGEVTLEKFLRNFIPEKPGKISLLPPPYKGGVWGGLDSRRSLPSTEIGGGNDKMRALGEHHGVQFYTIGQRHGLGIRGGLPAGSAFVATSAKGAALAKEGGGEPLYVAAKDVKKNILYVAPKDHPALFAKELILKDMHWVSGMASKLPLTCEARIRYRQPLQDCRIMNYGLRIRGKTKSAIRNSPSVIRVAFRDPQWAPPPGQSVVLYQGENVIGGGAIA